MRRSVELAKAARDEVRRYNRWVAASVGPYGAALANGEEYVGRYGLSVAQLADWHRPRLEILADAGADVLALETVPDVDEAEALVGLVHELGVPAWLSYTIAGPTTRAGQPLADAFAVAAGVPEIVAVGVNCCAPDDVEHAVGWPGRRQASPSSSTPTAAKSGTASAERGSATPGWSADLAPRWAAAGARIIGGCCRVRPDDIAALASTLR